MDHDTPRPEAAPGGVIAREHVHVMTEAARVGPHGHPAAAEPRVHLIRDGDTVRAIEVVCTCGERIVLNCVY